MSESTRWIWNVGPTVVVPIFKAKGDVRNSSCHRAVKLLEHRIKMVERALEKRLCRTVSIFELQFGFMPEGAKIVALLVLRMEEEYHAKGKKLYMCFVDRKKAYYRVP